MNLQPLRIGIPARIQHPTGEGHDLHGHSYHFLEQTLAHWVMSHGAMLFMIPSLCDQCVSTGGVLDTYDYSKALDGLILQGGPDIAPELYGECPRYNAWAGDITHDSHQIRLFRQFLTARKPILGICRGAQLINVALGGTLHQDLPSELASQDGHAKSTRDQVVHEVVWDADSGLAKLYPERQSGLVVSMHHQAIKELAKGLNVEARSATDNVIEAIRLNGSPYALGLQWHPECHLGNPQLLDCNPILDEFLTAARSTREGFQ